MKILIVAEEFLLADPLCALLRAEGFEAEAVYDGAYAALDMYDLLLLDAMLPGSYAVVREVRARRSTVPVLMLTDRSDPESRVRGLNAGADYCLTKPVDLREVSACVHALLRRQGGQINELSFGNTVLDLESGVLRCGASRVRLSSREFDVMRLLLRAGDGNIPKERLLVRVWGYDTSAVENNVEVYVGLLRKKLKRLGSNVRIQAVRKIGYHLEVQEEKV